MDGLEISTFDEVSRALRGFVTVCVDDGPLTPGGARTVQRLTDPGHLGDESVEGVSR
jgi:hypothetical protein